MSNLNITLAVTPSTKKCIQTGTPSIRETVNFVFTGLTGTAASNLRLFLIHNGELMATCETFTADGASYVASTNLNTVPLIELFGNRRGKTTKDIRVNVQDIVQDIDFLNDEIEIMDHPYQDGMADPTVVDPIDGVDYAPLAGYNSHVNDSTIHITSGDHTAWDGAVTGLASHAGDSTIHFTTAERNKLTGIEAAATADQTASEIKTALETLTLTDRLSADSVKTGSTNLFMTSAERSKLSGIEAAATADMTGAEIKSAYEAEADTNAFTDAEKTKLGNMPAFTTSDGITAGTTNLFMTAAERAKLTGIEASATADQTAAEIRDALQTLTTTNRLSADSVKDGSTNLFLIAAERSKLAGIEAGAEANPSNAEIKSAYEANADTNAFTDAYKAKLDALPSAAAQTLLSDNTTNYVPLGLAASYQSFFINYQFNNTINFVTGTLVVAHDGTTAFVTPMGAGVYPADISGVTFDADISDGTVRLSATLASVSSDLRMTYQITSKLPVYVVA